MQSRRFQTLAEQLNDNQRKAVEKIEGAVMVIAGPGTGKTQVLTLRIANILLKSQVEPENILALTFTESGVAAMRKRLVSIIGALAYRVNIFTFHSFSNYIIQTHPEDFGKLLAFQPITELEQVEILQEIFQTQTFKHIKPIGDQFFYLRAAQTAISELKRENVNLERLAKALQTELKDFEQIDDLYHPKGRYKDTMKGKYKDQLKQIEKNQDLLLLFGLYQAKLEELQYYDFDDMLIFLIKGLKENEDLLLRMQEKFQFFLIDEHQDTNKAQNEIVQLLASYHPNPNIFAVGDERQAIYRFQGASLENFLQLQRLYPEAEIITLEENYRSTQTILDASESVISNNVLPPLGLPERKSLRAQTNYHNQELQIADLPDQNAEYHYVADSIHKALAAGEKPEEIAILSRTNSELKEMQAVLLSKGIDCILESRENILETLPIRKLITLLQATAYVGRNNLLLRALHVDYLNVHPLDIYKLSEFAKQNETTLWSLLTDIDNAKGEFQNPNQLKHITSLLLKWHVMSHNKTLDEVFVTILKESGALYSDVEKNPVQQAVGVYHSLYEQIKLKLDKNPHYTLEEFLQFIELLQNHNLTINSQVNLGKSNAVRLMTAHGSKGLEFERVYLVNVFDGKWGNKRGGFAQFKLPYEYLELVSKSELVEDDKNADERRLFYVALTRAKKTVTISYANARLDGKEQVPSQFLSEVEAGYQKQVDTSSFVESFRENSQQIFLSKPNFDSKSKNYLKQMEDYVRSSFDENGLSATALNNYLTCPWQYFFRNVIKLPEEKSLSLVFGNAIHQLINEFLTKRIPDTKAAFMERYTSILKNEVLTKSELAQLLAKGNEILPDYFDKRVNSWSSKNQSELWISGVGIGKDIKLRGKIDMLEPQGESQYIVYDFKTGKPKSRNDIEGKTKSSTGDYKRQLVFYKLLMDRYQSGRMKMTQGVIEFIQPTSSGQLKSEAFDILEEDLQELENTIIRVADEIRSLSFWNKQCDDPACEYCGLREMMG